MLGWVVFLGLLAGYLLLLQALRRMPQPLPGGFEVNGPFVFWRTQLGKRWIEKVSRPRRFWNVVADVGIVATWSTGAAIFALLLYQLTFYFTAPEIVAGSAPSLNLLIGVPGVNPLIPVGFGIVALVVALVIHEGSHGVMAYVARMRVKSLGLLFFILPVGAFVEPDEEDLERASTRAKNRVFAAGPASNLVLALVAGILLASILGHVAVANGGQGVGVGSIVAGSAAEQAGLHTGDILVSVAGQRVATATQYSEVMNRTRAGETISVEYLRDGEMRHARMTLTDKHAYLVTVLDVDALSPDERRQLEQERGKGFMGIGPLGMGRIAYLERVLQQPFHDGFPRSFYTGSQHTPGSFMLFISYPFLVFATNVDLLAPPYSNFLVIQGPLADLPEPLVLGTASLLYWIVWINLMLASFNALPMGPLDGGQMFKATLRERLMRRYRVDRERVEIERAEVGGLRLRGRDAETQAKLDRIQHVLSRATWTLGLFILTLVVLPVFGPRLLGLFL